MCRCGTIVNGAIWKPRDAWLVWHSGRRYIVDVEARVDGRAKKVSTEKSAPFSILGAAHGISVFPAFGVRDVRSVL